MNIVITVLLIIVACTLLIMRNKYLIKERAISISKWDEQFELLESFNMQDRVNIYSFMHGYLKCNPDVYDAIQEAINNERHCKSNNS
jgi:hypothetical protein